MVVILVFFGGHLGYLTKRDFDMKFGGNQVIND